MAHTSNPVTDDERKRILDLHAQGMGRNDIARETGRSAATVSAIVKAAGGSFDRAATKAATEARKADLAARRVGLREQFMNRASELLDMFDKPVLVFNFGGKDNTYEERTLDRPTISDMRSLVQAASTASTAEIRIEQAETARGDDTGKSLLIGLATALGVTGPPQENTDDSNAS